MVEQARRAAERLLAEDPQSAPELIERCFLLLLGRKPTSVERETADAFLADAWLENDRVADLVQALFASTSFRLLD